MATVSQWNPFGVSMNITATAGTVTRTSATKYTVKINASWKVYWQNNKTNYGMTASSGGGSVTLNKFGTSASSGSGTFTGTYSIDGNSSASKTITVTFKNFNSDNGKSATKNVSFSVTVPAWSSYTIKYDANGGSGAPSSQTKWKDQKLTLSSTKPTRTGYTFSKWNTKADGSGTSYSAGASYTSNASATLYAQWTPITYTITYNANGGTLGSVTTQKKNYGVSITLSGTATRTNYNFLGWSTSKTATAATYKKGSSFSTNANTTLYAVWELAYVKPKITKLSTERCTSGGDISDEGTSALVRFDWTTDVDVVSITIKWKASNVTSWNSVSASASGKSGSVSQVIGNDKLNVDTSYDVAVEVADANASQTKTGTVQGTAFPVDVKTGGKGVAFGGPATSNNTAEFYYKIKAREDLNFYINNKAIRGVKPGTTTLVEAFNPQNSNGNTIIGYGNYSNAEGNTNVYGHDINFGVSNIAEPGSFRPYRRQGDSLTFSALRTSGYVTNSGTDVSFVAPISVPIIGSPTVTVTSVKGFVLRQGGKYTHGSSAEVFVVPDSYSATAGAFGGIHIIAKFSNATNATNNDAIGIYWNGTITFS